MINTVLILGAGASAPYGFPTGPGYKKAILAALRKPDTNSLWAQAFDGILVNHTMVTAERHQLANDFEGSGQNSIDLFLQRREASDQNPERRSEFLQIGKVAIAMVILEAEKKSEKDKSLFFDPAKHDRWYQELWRYLDEGLTNFGSRGVAVVTFNYDRSLEYFLYHALKTNYALDDDHAIAQLRKRIPIQHVYGSIGPAHFEEPKIGVKYGYPAIRSAAANIHIVGERTDAFERIQASAHEWLRESKRISFLGFGFAPENIAVLDMPNTSKGKTLHTTGKGLNPRDIAQVLAMFDEGIREKSIGGFDEDIVTCWGNLPLVPIPGVHNGPWGE